MKRKEFAVAGATLTFVTYVLALSLAGQVLSASQKSKTISNAGTVMAIGVGVYWDNGCTDLVSSLDWGILEPGSNTNVTWYVQNHGNSVSTLSMYTSNWSPPTASSYMSLSWDYGGQSIKPDEVIQITLTLFVDGSIEGITSFSFDIALVGNG